MSFKELLAAHKIGRSRICNEPGEICPAAFQHALHSMEGARERWAKRIATGLSDVDLAGAIVKEFGEYTSGGYGPGWVVMGLRFWSGQAGNGQGGRRKPDLQGKELVADVREFLGVPYPQATSNAAPWAGLPMFTEGRG